MRKLILSAAVAALAAPVLAEDAALLLGVERYEEFRRLSGGDDLVNSEDDLRDAGFDVEFATNADGTDMLPQLNRFAADAVDANRLIAALSGRFYTDGDRTWLLAADARRPSVFGMGDTIVSVDAILGVLASTPGQALLVLGLDTGSDDGIGTYLREGLGNLDVPQGVTVVIVAPSAVDDVLDEAARPGGDVMEYVRDNRRVVARGYQPRQLVLQSEGNTSPAPRPATDLTLAAWDAAQATDTADSYRDFLFRFPGSRYASEARRKLDEIENDPVRLDRLSEERLNLGRNARRDIQRNLTLLDFNTRGVDGIFGPGSRGAIRNWQQSNGFEQTSFLTREQINRIDAQASRRKAEIAAEESRAREEAIRLDRAYWEETGARGDEAGYRAYLERYPDGAFADVAKTQLETLAPPKVEVTDDEQARQQERGLNINPILARLIESRLDQLGFNPGQVDGRFDANTRNAISRYQTSRNLPSTGYLSEPTLARLLADTFR